MLAWAAAGAVRLRVISRRGDDAPPPSVARAHALHGSDDSTSIAQLLPAYQSTIEREDPGTFNEVIELAASPVGQIIVPPGESGFVPNPPPAAAPANFRDQLALYEAFQYRPMPFALGDLEGPTTTQTLTLP